MSRTTQSTPKIDPILLDDLVEGTLSSAKYRDLLKALEENPEGWRLCALAFLEDQALRRDLKECKQLAETQRVRLGQAATVEVPSAANSSAKGQVQSHGRGGLAAGSSVEDASPIASLASTVEMPTVANRSEFGWKRISQAALSIAACTLVAFGIGWQSHRLTNREADRSSMQSSLAESGSEQQTTMRPVVSDPPQVMLNTGMDRGEFSMVNMPTEELEIPTEDVVETSMVTLDEGIFQLEKRQSYVPVRSEDGREYVIPIENVRLKPVGLKGF